MRTTGKDSHDKLQMQLDEGVKDVKVVLDLRYLEMLSATWRQLGMPSGAAMGTRTAAAAVAAAAARA